VTWVTVGLRDIRPGQGLDVCLVPSCDGHLNQVRAYLSEFGPCQSMDPALAPAAAHETREHSRQRLVLIELNAATG
jgi:hypothetical protein